MDSGASKHMTGYRETITDLTKNKSALQVELGDDTKYAVRGVGSTSIKLDSGDSLHVGDVLYVPGFRKNMFSI